MANPTSQDVEKIYNDIISVCEARIYSLKNRIEEDGVDDRTRSPENVQLNTLIDIENNCDFRRYSELRADIRKCNDNDLLQAFRDEFKRQLKSYQMRQMSKKCAPPPSIHRYFKRFSKPGHQDSLVYYHYDSSTNVRQLDLNSGDLPILLVSGQDDSKLCPMKLEDMELARAAGEEITESEFNSLWYAHGGFPYVRSARRARRQLTRVLFRAV